MRTDPSFSRPFAEFNADALDRWLAGESPPDESAHFREYIARVPGAQEWIADFKASRLHTTADFSMDLATREAHALVAKRIGVFPGDNAPVPSRVAPVAPVGHTRRRDASVTAMRVGRRAFRGAATHWATRAIACAAVLVGVVYGVTRPAPQPTSSGKTYATTVNQRATVRLADGTRVTLAPRSVLRVDPGYGVTRRHVAVTGQAYFSVNAESGVPLVVTSGSVTTRVLGTEFMVRHYEGVKDVVVAVSSGKVVATGRKGPVVLTAYRIARFHDSTQVVTTDSTLKDYVEWTQGRLVFTGVSAAEIASVLGYWYGITFKFSDSAMAQYELSGTFDDHISRQEMLQNLRLILNAQMTADGNVITLAPKRRTVTPKMQHESATMRTEVGR